MSHGFKLSSFIAFNNIAGSVGNILEALDGCFKIVQLFFAAIPGQIKKFLYGFVKMGQTDLFDLIGQ